MTEVSFTITVMTCPQRQIIGELVALDPTGEVPMAVP
mgnify:CR=1 FL=1